jgi:hypothetical protein
MANFTRYLLLLTICDIFRVPALLWSGHRSSSTKFYHQLCQLLAEYRKYRVSGRALALPTARRENLDPDRRLKSDVFHYDYWILCHVLDNADSSRMSSKSIGSASSLYAPAFDTSDSGINL